MSPLQLQALWRYKHHPDHGMGPDSWVLMLLAPSGRMGCGGHIPMLPPLLPWLGMQAPPWQLERAPSVLLRMPVHPLSEVPLRGSFRCPRVLSRGAFWDYKCPTSCRFQGIHKGVVSLCHDADFAPEIHYLTVL